MEKNILGQNIFWEGWFLEHGLLSIGGSCHNYHFCHGKTHLLSLQKYACRFVATNIILSWQAYFCHTQKKKRVCCDKTHLLLRQKFATCLSQQKFVTTKYFVATSFVAASILLTKIILVAPANDTTGNQSYFFLMFFGRERKKKQQHFLNVHTHTIHTKKQSLCSAGFLKQSISWK